MRTDLVTPYKQGYVSSFEEILKEDVALDSVYTEEMLNLITDRYLASSNTPEGSYNIGRMDGIRAAIQGNTHFYKRFIEELRGQEHAQE